MSRIVPHRIVLGRCRDDRLEAALLAAFADEPKELMLSACAQGEPADLLVGFASKSLILDAPFCPCGHQSRYRRIGRKPELALDVAFGVREVHPK